MVSLGAGPEGIPTGSPLAPGEGRFVARTTVWALGGAIIVGLLVGAFGIGALQEGILGDGAAAAVIALGAVLFFGPMAIGIVSAWRAGFRYPGFSRHPSLFERQMGVICVGSPVVVVLLIAADGLGRETPVGQVLRILGVVGGCSIWTFYAIPTLWSVIFRPGDYEHGGRWLCLSVALGLTAVIVLSLVGVLPEL